jgi:hypothetical protein
MWLEEVADVPRWDDDEALMADLREALRHDRAVSAHRREAAHAAFSWRSVDEELARLAYDSLEGAAAAVRGADDTRLLSFEADGLTIELEISGDTVWGQVMPGQAYEVTIENAAGSRRSVIADESGIFTLEPVRGSVKFTFRCGDHVRRTEWVLL